MRQLFIIRGVPGSGKTTLARQIADTTVEADMFFYFNGKYLYDKTKIVEAHEWCKAETERMMVAQVPKIAVSNTFVKRWEMDSYYALAVKHEYIVTEITMSGAVRDNLHSVPSETIKRMLDSWEK